VIRRDVLRISLLRSLYLSARFGGRIILLRGTRLRLESGARILVPRGCRLVIGRHVAGAPASVHLMRNARLSVRGQGRVTISRSARILVMDDAHLEIGGETTIHFNAAVTCMKHISIAPSCAISWNTNILDGNLHELIVDGVPQPRTSPVSLGSYAWIGCGATVIGARIGAGAVVGAGSVVTSNVPDKVVVAGNPARMIRKDVSWRA
jgi:acetyltransferase-like isoleucine patch superfamily enzyme